MKIVETTNYLAFGGATHACMHLNEKLKQYIEKDAFKTKSEFIRTAVRDRLEQEMEKLEEAKK